MIFISNFQLSLLIYDLLMTEVWKEKVFTEIVDTEGFEPKTTFPLYMAVSLSNNLNLISLRYILESLYQFFKR